MPITIREAQTGHDLKQVYTLRRQVFVDEEQRFEHGEATIIDLYDACPHSRNFIALEDTRPIGAVRATLQNELGSPAAEHYDFMPYLEQAGIVEKPVATISWLCTIQEFRRNPALLMGLLKMLTRYVLHHKHRHIIAPLHPGALPTLEHIGAKAIASEVISPVLGVPIVPIHVDLTQLPPGARESSQLPYDMMFRESRERRIYRKGEIINRRGESGREAYVVMRGAARTVREDAGAAQGDLARELLQGPVSEHEFLYGPGELFGELSLLDEGPRTITIVGYSREVDVMVLNHDEFMAQLRSNPERGIRLARLLGTRMRIAMGEMAPMEPSRKLIALTLYDASQAGTFPINIGWLAAQTGTWVKRLRPILLQWSDYLKMESDDTIHLTEPLEFVQFTGKEKLKDSN